MKNIKELISKAISMARQLKNPTMNQPNYRAMGLRHSEHEIIQALLPDMPDIEDKTPSMLEFDRATYAGYAIPEDIQAVADKLIAVETKLFEEYAEKYEKYGKTDADRNAGLGHKHMREGMRTLCSALKFFCGKRIELKPTPPASTNDMPEEKPEGYVIIKEGTDNLYSASHMLFHHEKEALEWCKKNIDKGWQIRPVKLQFMDGK